jgi:hypothetical protein|tara:strand:+ start:96 stop:665 length:570 start_codon:yes stop_codon:yes gene_type:complete
MIYVKDNFLPSELIEYFENDKSIFEEVKTPGKSFWVKNLPKEFIDAVCDKISILEGCKIENILMFIRQAKKSQDVDWRIHNDSIIENQKPDRAVVLFLSKENEDGLNGTAFWSHKDYGDTYDSEGTEEFNRLLTEDANDLSKWELNTVIGHKQNRLISYPCKYFHSKYPNEFENNREVIVMFYKTNRNE